MDALISTGIVEAGKYLCINSCGDYCSVKPQTVIVDCENKGEVFDSAYNTTDSKSFYTVRILPDSLIHTNVCNLSTPSILRP